MPAAHTQQNLTQVTPLEKGILTFFRFDTQSLQQYSVFVSPNKCFQESNQAFDCF